MYFHDTEFIGNTFRLNASPGIEFYEFASIRPRREFFTRIPQMNCQFDDVLGRFCYKNQCNTIITTGQTRVTRWVNPESLIYGSISTVA